MTSVSFHKHPFSLRLKKPLALKRRPLRSNDPLVYASEIMSATDKCRTGYGEVVYSEKLAQEMALLDLKSRQKGCSIPELLGRKIYHEQVPIAWMYPTCHPGLDPGSSAGPRVKPGVTAALKFKITHNYVQEAEYLTDIQKAVGPNMPIRLDANQKLSLKEAINFGKRIAHLNIAYFEEPLKDPSQIPQFVQATGIPVALDESLSTTYRCHPGLACP
ncbi:MAG: mandelate racemase/muconate lactonizing enzyme family protein, partial [Deltaproteobacteria bacterium]|nr:mandelate racemase/muconate lactonizing enzyme family protein [Deltaproteobacteria bacterium]